MVVADEQVRQPRGRARRRRASRARRARRAGRCGPCPPEAGGGSAARPSRRRRRRPASACRRGAPGRRRSPRAPAPPGRSRAGRCRPTGPPQARRDLLSRGVAAGARRAGRRSRRSGRAASAPSPARDHAPARRAGSGKTGGSGNVCVGGDRRGRPLAAGRRRLIGDPRRATRAADRRPPGASTPRRSASVAAGSAVRPRHTCVQNARPASTSPSLSSGSWSSTWTSSGMTRISSVSPLNRVSSPTGRSATGTAASATVARGDDLSESRAERLVRTPMRAARPRSPTRARRRSPRRVPPVPRPGHRRRSGGRGRARAGLRQAGLSRDVAVDRRGDVLAQSAAARAEASGRTSAFRVRRPRRGCSAGGSRSAARMATRTGCW